MRVLALCCAAAVFLAACGLPSRALAAPRASDKEALVALYNATGGENWKNSTNWLSDAPIDEWHGVVTDDSGRVVALSLHWNNLRGLDSRGSGEPLQPGVPEPRLEPVDWADTGRAGQLAQAGDSQPSGQPVEWGHTSPLGRLFQPGVPGPLGQPAEWNDNHPSWEGSSIWNTWDSQRTT